MSYDIYTTMDTGAGNTIETDFSQNYTYNVSKMLYDALPGDKGLNALDGTPASDMIGILDIAIDKFYKNQELYRSWEPDNGWGDYTGILNVLVALHTHCKLNPNVVVRVC